MNILPFQMLCPKNTMIAQTDGRNVLLHAILLQAAVFQARTSEVLPGALPL